MKSATKMEMSSADVETASFQLDDFLPYRLSVAANRVSRMFSRRFAEAFGLSIPEWRVLATLGLVGNASPSSVGEMAAMDKVKVSRAAASLVARGLVRQTQDPDDGRARVLRLTRKGTTSYHNAVPLAREMETEIAAGLSKAEWASLHKALNRLLQHVEALHGPDDGKSDD
jgi:DNA-binding MarR family transcriptional regulator